MTVPALAEGLAFTDVGIRVFENINLKKQHTSSTRQCLKRMLAYSEVILKEEMFLSSTIQCLIS
jgi:hypothetical protein